MALIIHTRSVLGSWTLLHQRGPHWHGMLGQTFQTSRNCLTPHAQQEKDKIVAQQIEQGLIKETHDGTWASLALLLQKTSGKFHLVIDYQLLNDATIPLVIHMLCLN